MYDKMASVENKKNVEHLCVIEFGGMRFRSR
jgi:hypothetical protein